MKTMLAAGLLAALVAGCASRPEMYAETRSYYGPDYRTDVYRRSYYDGDRYTYHEYHSMDGRSGEGDPFREHGN